MRAALVLTPLLVLVALLGPPAALADDEGDPSEPLVHRGDRYAPEPAGTVKEYKLWFGPYLVPPGHDMNRVDLELPVHDGFILSIEPGMRRVADNTEPSHQEAHIHHAHWFALDPGNPEDNYFGGNQEWIFGNGDEETKADFQPRTEAGGPDGPVYGQFVGTAAPQTMIYMLHNKTAQTLPVYIVLDVTFKHGTAEQLEALEGRPHRDVTGVLFGRTYDVPRGADSDGDGNFEYAEDSRDADGNPRVIEWTSTVDGTIIGTGGHLHPGGRRVVVENYGSQDRPCADDGRGYGGTLLLNSDALFHHGIEFSEDFQMEVSDPAWRAPIRKGDRIRISGTYESRDHAWYAVMTHEGLYIDPEQPPGPGCAPVLIDGSDRDPTEGVPNREWHEPGDSVCDRPDVPTNTGPCEGEDQASEPGQETTAVAIANFLYLPGDRSASGATGAPPRVRHGESLTFLNVDQGANIRHTVTTCRWPCTGRYTANYPFADGVWDSGTMGYDVVDGGSPSPVASTPPDLPVGKYSYFCRIHPWMRGAFEVVP